MSTNRTYQTQSLYEASFLLASGFKLLSKNTQGPKTTLFFQDNPELQATLMSFYNGEGKVSGKQMMDWYRTLKDMIFRNE